MTSPKQSNRVEINLSIADPLSNSQQPSIFAQLRTLENMLSSFVSNHQKDWDKFVPILMTYRSAEHERTRDNQIVEEVELHVLEKDVNILEKTDKSVNTSSSLTFSSGSSISSSSSAPVKKSSSAKKSQKAENLVVEENVGNEIEPLRSVDFSARTELVETFLQSLQDTQENTLTLNVGGMKEETKIGHARKDSSGRRNLNERVRQHLESRDEQDSIITLPDDDDPTGGLAVEWIKLPERRNLLNSKTSARIISSPDNTCEPPSTE
ncbi:unnamed protein product [Mytilus coruscus]|uniref:Uncharacterized protein n=1 Tax=Mytilus coruscus TaxID=42192 RepID=A0A6J8BT11_MYTCO|nr:unnamed protein product [Mytilus coruscus]